MQVFKPSLKSYFAAILDAFFRRYLLLLRNGELMDLFARIMWHNICEWRFDISTLLRTDSTVVCRHIGYVIEPNGSPHQSSYSYIKTLISVRKSPSMRWNTSTVTSWRIQMKTIKIDEGRKHRKERHINWYADNWQCSIDRTLRTGTGTSDIMVQTSETLQFAKFETRQKNQRLKFKSWQVQFLLFPIANS